MFPNPNGVASTVRAPGAYNPFRVVEFSERFPRVARASQPWAERHYPVGVNEYGAGASYESRTLAALRDALLPKLSGELRVPAGKLTEANL